MKMKTKTTTTMTELFVDRISLHHKCTFEAQTISLESQRSISLPDCRCCPKFASRAFDEKAVLLPKAYEDVIALNPHRSGIKVSDQAGATAAMTRWPRWRLASPPVTSGPVPAHILIDHKSNPGEPDIETCFVLLPCDP